MEDGHFSKLIEALKFTPELGPPSLMEFLALLGIVVCLVYVGHFIKSFWARNNELVPIPTAFLMALGMFVVYFLLASMLYRGAQDNQRTNLLMWSVFALALPAIYYGRIIVESFATRVIDQVSPFSLRIEEPSEFAEARKLALRRDIDGAVKRYRAYLENTDAALFEAARLLKSEDRFAEAAALFQEIAERFYGKKAVWAEATYHLAKVKEANLHQTREAMGLLDSILERTPDNRFGLLAQTERTRMQSLYSIEKDGPVQYADTDPGDSMDPFYAEGTAASSRVRGADDNGQGHRRGGEDLPVPSVDPFYAAALKRAALDTGESPEASDADAASEAPEHSEQSEANG